MAMVFYCIPPSAIVRGIIIIILELTDYDGGIYFTDTLQRCILV